MATTEKKNYTFAGVKLAYCRPFVKDKYARYATQVFVSDEQRRAIKATGIRSNPMEDENGGGWFYTLGNKAKPPVVEDADGNEWDKEKLIGNGSEATIELTVEKFQTKDWGEVTRGSLTRIRIDKYIPYERPAEKEEAPTETAKSKDMPF